MFETAESDGLQPELTGQVVPTDFSPSSAQLDLTDFSPSMAQLDDRSDWSARAEVGQMPQFQTLRDAL